MPNYPMVPMAVLVGGDGSQQVTAPVKRPSAIRLSASLTSWRVSLGWPAWALLLVRVPLSPVRR